MISNSSVPADPAIDAHEIRKSAWSAADVAHKAFQSAEAALDVARANYNAAKSIADAACDIDLSSIDVSLKVNINAEDAAVAPKKPLPTPRGYMTSTWLSRRLSTKNTK